MRAARARYGDEVRTVAGWRAHRCTPSVTTILRVCGTWTAAWWAACPGAPGRRKHWTVEKARQAVIEAVERYGPGVLRESVWERRVAQPKVSTLVHLFGSWEDVKAAVPQRVRPAS